MSKDTGGPAFPTLDYITPTQVASNQDGMTLRDYFAAKVMQAMVTAVFSEAVSAKDTVDAIKEIPATAYHIADGMIAERAK